MGMFDTVICEYPLPTEDLQEDTFQTKDFDNVMDVYKITKSNRLLREKYKYETVPEEERPYYGKPEWNNKFMQLVGSLKRIHIGWEDTNFHGKIKFYTIRSGNLVTYIAKFTDGKLINILLNVAENS